ncbi:M50 family metallopeptidase [Endomicrobium proavitum]|uniref:Putative zinc metalloprotease n=1 Tax=Endomicrobium proavitum TaxID=1408281 RepID=A0A0G3WIE5_9BACT|nr:M50 family metallopeptidase [Endomicrobium proavitum]AKL97655.1 putative zinc metalloprotease [Endomicrobium proavitum]
MIIALQILAVVFGLGLLIFIHELGHFAAARFFKVKVLTFAFGFGPDIIKYKYKGTKYAVKAIPLGGFVSMAGDNPDEATGAAGEYLSLAWYKKIIISFTGPFSNYLLAAVLFVFIFNVWGMIRPVNIPKIAELAESYPAQKAGLLPGDVIKSIDGASIKTWNELSENIKKRADKKTSFVVLRGTSTFRTTLTVNSNGLIGISPEYVAVKIGFKKSLKQGLKAPVAYTLNTVSYLYGAAKNKVKPELSGPIGVMKVMASAAKSGLQDYLFLLAVISVALGLFNLFPIPFVDGGMIVLFFAEGIIRKKINTKIIAIYNTIGLIIIAGIFIFATYSDLVRLGVDKLFK